MPALHQFTPTLDAGAIGSHSLEIQRTLRAAGWDSEIFAEHTRAPYEGRAHVHTDYGTAYPAGPDDVLVYHVAIGSSVADWLMSHHRRKLVIDYHNITPPSWFDGWEPDVAYGLGWGRAQLRRLARRARFGLADSRYNADELDRMGFRATAVLPILVPDAALAGAPDPELLERLVARTGAHWVFVGRVAPNKRQHLLVAALAVYRRVFDPRATLTLIGGASSDGYADAVRRYAAELGVSDAVSMTGAVSDAERNAYYAGADVFVCLSAHEGFLVPLLEAWHHRLAVVAYRAAAVPETVADGGLLLNTADAASVATAVNRVVTDPAVGGALRAAGSRRLDELSLARAEARLLELAPSLVEHLHDEPPLVRRMR